MFVPVFLCVLGYCFFLLLLHKSKKVYCALFTAFFLFFIGGVCYLNTIFVHKHYHAICNTGVAKPFNKLVLNLHNLMLNQRYLQIENVLKELEDDGGSTLSSVWLYGNSDDFDILIDNILKIEQGQGSASPFKGVLPKPLETEPENKAPIKAPVNHKTPLPSI